MAARAARWSAEAASRFQKSVAVMAAITLSSSWRWSARSGMAAGSPGSAGCSLWVLRQVSMTR